MTRFVQLIKAWFIPRWEVWLTIGQEDRKALMADLIACIMLVALGISYVLFSFEWAIEPFILIFNKILPGTIAMPDFSESTSSSNVGDGPSAITPLEIYGRLLYVMIMLGILIYGRLMRLSLGKHSYPIIGLIVIFLVGFYFALDFLSVYLFADHADYMIDVIHTIGWLCCWYLIQTKKLLLFFALPFSFKLKGEPKMSLRRWIFLNLLFILEIWLIWSS